MFSNIEFVCISFLHGSPEETFLLITFDLFVITYYLLVFTYFYYLFIITYYLLVSSGSSGRKSGGCSNSRKVVVE